MAALNNEVRRLPTDQQLIEGYLFNVTNGNPPDDVFNTDVYSDRAFWRTYFELFDDEDTLYFFTRLTPMSENAERIRRGRWKRQNRRKLIHNDDGEIIGSKGKFSFIEGVPEPLGTWVMQEYQLEGPYRNEWGLCRIRNNMGRVADYGPPDDEEMSKMMMDLENIIRGDGQN